MAPSAKGAGPPQPPAAFGVCPFGGDNRPAEADGRAGAAMADTVGEALDLSEEIAGGVGAVKSVWKRLLKRRGA